MGLKQEAETSFGNQSDRPLPHPATAGLPWFRGGLAGLLTFAGTHGMLPDRAFAQSLPQSTEITTTLSSLSSLSSETAEAAVLTPLTLELSNRVTQEIVKPTVNLGLDVDLTGELLTNAFLDDEGNRNIVYRNIWFQVGMDGRLKIVNVLDQLSKQGLDDKLDFGLFGDPLPPKQDPAIEIGEEIKEFLSALNSVLDIGPVVGYKNYGPFEVYRTPNVAIMRILEGPQANTFQLTNTGYQALITGLFPKEYALSPLPFATGGGTAEIPTKPVEKSAAYQRVVNNLRELLTSIASGSTGVVSNPEGLDPNEVAEYIAHPEKTVFNTFRIWSKPNNDPWLIIVTGERSEGAPAQGLTKPENITNVIAALNRLHAIDPQIFDTLEQYGLIAIAGHVPFFKVTGASAGFGNGRIYLNEVNTPDPVGDPGADLMMMYVILDESRHMYTLTPSNSAVLLDPNSGIDKALWANNWLDAHSAAFTAGEQRVWRSLSRQVIDWYTKNPHYFSS